MRAPCMGCPDRVVLCHSTCEKYKEFRKELDKMNSLEAARRDIGIYFKELSYKGKKKSIWKRRK